MTAAQAHTAVISTPAKLVAALVWPLLRQAGGLAELAVGQLQLTDRGRSALAKPTATTIRKLLRSWVTTAVPPPPT